MDKKNDISKFFLGGINDDLETYKDRLLLRLHEYPPYTQKLQQVARNGGMLELVFSAMPPEAIPTLRDIIGPASAKIEFKSFQDSDGNPMVGVTVRPSGLSASDEAKDTPEDTK